jgi:hypothetical protein
MTSPDLVVPESLWRPRSAVRLIVGLLVALGLPLLVTKAVTGGAVDKFPSLSYVVCVVIAAMLGRMIAGLVAVVVSVLMLDYYVVSPPWSFLPPHTTGDAIDFLLFIAVGLIIAAALAGTDRARAAAQHARHRADFAQRQMAHIAEVSRALAASFDLPATAAQVCQRVADFAGWDQVIVLQRKASEWQCLAAVPDSGRFKSGQAMEEITPAMQSAQVHVLKPASWRAKEFGPWRYRSGLVVPLLSGSGTVGALALLHTGKARTYLPGDLLLAGEIGGRIAVAVDNANRYQAQAHIAHTLQQGLLPRDLPTIPGVKLHVLYQAGVGTEVGGDFYDVFSVGENRWMAVVGDVCGKGPEAATVMSVTRATLRALGMHEPSPSRLLKSLNEALLAQIPDDRFVTVTCALIEVIPAGGAKVILAQAGHPAPVITRKGSPPALAPAANGILLGAFPKVELSETAIGLDAGEVLTFYTDGIESGQVTAQDRALSLLAEHGDAPASQIAQRFAAAVPSTPLGKSDDLVVLALEFTA